MKKKTEKKSADFGRQKNLMILLMVGFAVLTCFSVDNLVSCLVNLVVLGVMGWFIYRGMGLKPEQKGSSKLAGCRRDLNRLTAEIKRLAKESPADVWEQLRKITPELETPMVREALEAYYTESDRLNDEKNEYYTCDIDDFVNDDLIHDAGNVALNEFISNAMTGLGILGTFVGLAIGLKSFNTETAEAMTNSIAPLIEGIKVAFYTSIYGVVFSLYYGHIYRTSLLEAEQALDEFQSEFYRSAGFRTGNDAVNKLLRYERGQEQAFNQFAVDFAFTLGDVLQESFVPTIEGLGEKIQNLSDNLIEQMVQHQQTGIESMTQGFMDQLNSSVDGEFTHLAETIREMCQWQEDMQNTLTDTLKNMTENGDNLISINQSLENTVSHLNGFAEQMTKLLGDSNAHMLSTFEKMEKTESQIEELSNELAEIMERSSEIMSGVEGVHQSVLQQEQNIASLTESQTTMLKAGTDYVQQQGDVLRNSGEQLVSSFTEASHQMTLASEKLTNDMDNAMSRTYTQFDQQLATAIEHFSGTLHDLQRVVEATPRSVSGSADIMQQQATKYAQTMEQAQKQLLTEVENAMKLLQQQTSEMASTVHKLQNPPVWQNSNNQNGRR